MVFRSGEFVRKTCFSLKSELCSTSTNEIDERGETLFNEEQFSDFLRLEFKCDIVCQTFIYVIRVGCRMIMIKKESATRLFPGENFKILSSEKLFKSKSFSMSTEAQVDERHSKT
jgi:hypothetical protein